MRATAGGSRAHPVPRECISCDAGVGAGDLPAGLTDTLRDTEDVNPNRTQATGPAGRPGPRTGRVHAGPPPLALRRVAVCVREALVSSEDENSSLSVPRAQLRTPLLPGAPGPAQTCSSPLSSPESRGDPSTLPTGVPAAARCGPASGCTDPGGQDGTGSAEPMTAVGASLGEAAPTGEGPLWLSSHVCAG